MIIGAQEACLCALCFDSAGSNWCFERWTVLATFTLGYNHASPTSTYSCRTTSAIWTESHCTTGSWMDLSTDCCTCWAQCIAAFRSGLWNIPISLDEVLDGRAVQTHVKIDGFCEQRWPSEQNPGRKSGHMLHPLCHQGPLGTVCLQKGSNHACLWPGYHNMTPPSMATLVLWKSRLESGLALCFLQWWE